MGNQYGIQLHGAAQWSLAPNPVPWEVLGWYGYNAANATNVLASALEPSGVISTVQYNGIHDTWADDKQAYAVSAYGGNHRCFDAGISTAPTINDVLARVVCRDTLGNVVEGSFTHAYVV